MLGCATKPLLKPLSPVNNSKNFLPINFFNGERIISTSFVPISSTSIKPYQLSTSPSRSSRVRLASFSLRRGMTDSLAHTLSYGHYDKEKGGGFGCLREMALKMIRNCFAVEPPVDAVVKVICDYGESNFSFPWLRDPRRAASSGFIIGGRRILTCAHSVEHHIKVTLKKHNSNKLYKATVLAIAPECDIAMLTVSDEEFWRGVRPVELGDMPKLKDELFVSGYPLGVNKICTQSCFVLNMGMISYSHWPSKLLALQVNVETKNGNSGGPVFNDKGKCVGILFQSTLISTGMSYVIPVSVINHFLQDYDKNGAYTGFPTFGFKWQKMENVDLRMSMRMGHDQEGVLIREIEPNYPESLLLKPYDVILSIDGINIANDGTVPYMQGRRVDFSWLITEKFTGDDVLVKVLRDSEIHKFRIKLPTHKQFVPENTKGRPLSYYTIAGIVFTTLTVPYLQNYMYEKEYGDLSEKLLSQALYQERVVVCKVLKAEINNGYEEEEIINTQVLLFNDKPVESLKSLKAMIDSCDEEFLKFTFENQQTVVVQTSTAKATNLDILKTYCINSAMSDDLQK